MSDSARELRDGLTQPAPTWKELRQETDHADKAYEYLNSAPFNGDAEVVKHMIRAAEVHAQLALQDKLEELGQTVKFCTNAIIESNAQLNENVKTAASHLHRDAQSLERYLRVVREEAA